ncbi:hypothetical protein L1987_81616 [Smallanthus sonchifolius]|uniref:Uncharacterized protein n=1 Tax=Smallanthus sonchifolius TaxID=185202 RepID=A0ACB8YR58_9ASTR|nr:hypothetical protein L1987_81616 [Smallanthus sonchifolius]
MPSPISTLISLFISTLFFLCFSGNATTGTISFDFQTLTLTSLKFLGDAHMFNNSVRLTRDLPVPNSGAGRVLYNKPVRFRRPRNQNPANFITYFSFSVQNLNPDSIGGGLAFVISPDDEAVGDAGGFLGIPAGAVAVEFDTLMDFEFKDVNGNHVGLDLDSMVSTQVADLDLVNVNLRSGNLVNSWVEYSGSTQQLNISISYSNTKPKSPVLSFTANLNQYVNEFMFVGFAGSTQGSTEVHSVEWWSFTSSFDEPDVKPCPNSPPPPPLTATFMNPTATTVNSTPPSMAPTRSSLVDWAWSLHREGRLLAAADGRLGGEFEEAEMMKVLLVGLVCSHPDPSVRPTMRSVVQMLAGEAEVPVVPRAKPSLSFSTSDLLLNLQDSVSDLNEMVTLSTSSSEHSFNGDGLPLV